jgi:hypothetical protein
MKWAVEETSMEPMTDGDPLASTSKPMASTSKARIEFVQPEKQKRGLWKGFVAQMNEAAAQQNEFKARSHEAKAGKTFRRTNKHLKKADRARRNGESLR